ncbi:hypothetical protein NIES2107_16540 [Nostoc carneum NIES-2107]|nr:hypothetical protein NIES2107_16540 [Nostoc carneum NIES-2107]
MLQINNVQNEAQVSNLTSSTDELNYQLIRLSEVINEVEKSINCLQENFSKFPWDNRACYAEWLAQIYYQTSYTPRLEALAASRCNTNSSLFSLFLEGLKGELGHENLALKDLKSLGYSIESFPELPATSSFYHSLFYLMDYESPLSILGYKIPLEGFACHSSQKLFYKKMLGLYGESSTFFLKVHDSEDLAHYKQGLKMLEMCENKDLIAICKACQQLSYVSGAMLEAIAKKHLIN